MPRNITILNYAKLLYLKRILLLFFVCSYLNTYAQSPVQVKGVIVDEKNMPVADASIRVKNKNTGTISDSTGHFTISVPDKTAVLVISDIGFKTQEVAIPESGEITVQLIGENSMLSDVVVVGYGTQKRTSLTAAVSSLKGDEIKSTPVANISNALGGRVAGVLFKQGSGEPGYDGSTILIRGFSTTGNTAPLVIVDGVPRSFQQLDPNSVASFTI
ncbi:carboxypeptidase-like regulatory domain-containing protein, partial [Parafilimonas sp.]|uniref:carboxypeptidase-like regulatory domain-containing protein n=1 Tax=Parafilimonas sp. TaxID=1969739 RepID=UPI003F7E2792